MWLNPCKNLQCKRWVMNSQVCVMNVWSADNTNRQPSLKLTIIVRNGTRRFLNLDGIIRASEQLGFDVSLLSPKSSTELKKIFWHLNDTDVLLGVHDYFHRPPPWNVGLWWRWESRSKGGSGSGSGRNQEPTTPDNGHPAPFWGCRVRGLLSCFHRCQHRSRDVPGRCGPLLSTSSCSLTLQPLNQQGRSQFKHLTQGSPLA